MLKKGNTKRRRKGKKQTAPERFEPPTSEQIYRAHCFEIIEAWV
jgi:hypothetical protein